MYAFFLVSHNLLRWVVLILAIVVLVRAYRGWFQKREWSRLDRKFGVYFASVIDLQLVLGAILYLFYSPFALQGIMNFGLQNVMRQAEYRLFALEHLFYMLLAVVMVHLGTALPKRAQDALGKHKKAAIFFSLTVLFILIGMPWGRPLIPALG